VFVSTSSQHNNERIKKVQTLKEEEKEVEEEEER
jgi:hypothetical protein